MRRRDVRRCVTLRALDRRVRPAQAAPARSFRVEFTLRALADATTAIGRPVRVPFRRNKRRQRCARRTGLQSTLARRTSARRERRTSHVDVARQHVARRLARRATSATDPANRYAAHRGFAAQRDRDDREREPAPHRRHRHAGLQRRQDAGADVRRHSARPGPPDHPRGRRVARRDGRHRAPARPGRDHPQPEPGLRRQPEDVLRRGPRGRRGRRGDAPSGLPVRRDAHPRADRADPRGARPT